MNQWQGEHKGIYVDNGIRDIEERVDEWFAVPNTAILSFSVRLFITLSNMDS